MRTGAKLPTRGQWWKWAVVPLRRYARFDGRSAPLEFWMYSLFLLAGYLTIFMIGVALALIGNSAFVGEKIGMIVAGCWGIFFLGNFVPGLSLTARRLHDLGFSGHWVWAVCGALIVLNLIAWLAYLVVMSIPGQRAENRFGPPVYGKDIAGVFS
ncbi:DUF805 domain-containing protein [Pelagerythrobacter aerophilus]|nr:DUF805 domain-containing protein [Pelagerythrobacter aerophilus]